MNKVSDEVKKFILQGALMPFNPFSKKPIFLEFNGQFVLPVFSTKEKFDEAAKWGGFTFAKCSIIVNTDEFRNTVLDHKKRFNFHVVADPYITEKGNTRFQMIPFDEEEKVYLGEKSGQS